MSNPKFMTFKDLKEREKKENEERLKKLPFDINALMKASTSSNASTSYSTRALENVHTMAELKKKEEEREIVQNVKVSIFSVISLLIPISIAMVSVIMYTKFVCMKDCDKIRPNKWEQQKETESPFKLNLGSNPIVSVVVQIVIFFVAMIFVTFGLILCVYYKYDKLMMSIITIVFAILLLFSSYYIFRQILFWFNIPFDVITGCLLLWNYTVLGMVSIFWRAPLILNQSYLVIVSTLEAIVLLLLFPISIIWILLICLVVYDLIAVLSPYGPLRMLFTSMLKRKMEDKDGESAPDNLPGLLYSTMIWMTVLSTDKKEEGIEDPEEDPKDIQIEFRGPRLGLGDFVFYSLLTGVVALYGDFNLILGCYVGILVGLMATLYILLIYMMPLPALPISISLGVIIFVISYFCVTPFLDKLNSDLIFI